jgi:hypothetical protein
LNSTIPESDIEVDDGKVVVSQKELVEAFKNFVPKKELLEFLSRTTKLSVLNPSSPTTQYLFTQEQLYSEINNFSSDFKKYEFAGTVGAPASQPCEAKKADETKNILVNDLIGQVNKQLKDITDVEVSKNDWDRFCRAFSIDKERTTNSISARSGLPIEKVVNILTHHYDYKKKFGNAAPSQRLA